MKKLLEYKSILILLIISIILLFSGFFIGRSFGQYMFTDFLKGSSKLGLILYRPSLEYFTIFKLINSSDELERLSGYYSLLENRIIDEKFLNQRFLMEESILIKRTIIWILGSSESFIEIMEFYNKVYSGSNLQIKKEIIRIIKNRDEHYYHEFIKKNNIEKNVLDSI